MRCRGQLFEFLYRNLREYLNDDFSCPPPPPRTRRKGRNGKKSAPLLPSWRELRAREMSSFHPLQNDLQEDDIVGRGPGAGRFTAGRSPRKRRKRSGASQRNPLPRSYRTQNQIPFSHNFGVQQLQEVGILEDKEGMGNALGLLPIYHPSLDREGLSFLPPGLTPLSGRYSGVAGVRCPFARCLGDYVGKG